MYYPESLIVNRGKKSSISSDVLYNGRNAGNIACDVLYNGRNAGNIACDVLYIGCNADSIAKNSVGIGRNMVWILAAQIDYAAGISILRQFELHPHLRAKKIPTFVRH